MVKKGIEAHRRDVILHVYEPDGARIRELHSIFSLLMESAQAPVAGSSDTYASDQDEAGNVPKKSSSKKDSSKKTRRKL